MTNEEIIDEDGWCDCYNHYSVVELMEKARADERAKMTQKKFEEYFNSLKGGEVASAILTQLLRRGVTDNDLRGLRLQWITDERAKQQGVKVWVSRNKHIGYKVVGGRVSATKPEIFQRSRYEHYYRLFDELGTVGESLLDLLRIKEGECKAFEIREVV